MKIKLYLTFAVLLLITGCANTVTPVFNAGKHITIEINYKGNIDTSSAKYYIIFNNNAAPQIPFMPIQLVEPGEIPSQTGTDYYANYYPTWKSYIVLDSNTFYLVKGPYTSEAVPTKEVIATWSGADPDKISITLDMAKLPPVTERLNFDFVTVDKATKIVKDNLSPLTSSPSSYYVYTISDTTVSGSDEGTSGIPPSMDILNWRVLIQ